MDAAGHTLGWVNLRETSARDVWLGGAFWARPLFLKAGQAPWSDVFDALFYIRTQEPNHAAQ